MKFYQNANEKCKKLGCICVDCLLNTNDKEHCCGTCGLCKKNDHKRNTCEKYIKRNKVTG